VGRLILERIATDRLALEPVSPEQAQRIIAGESTELSTGVGWPHADTLDGLRMALRGGHAPGWLVTLDGVVIGDCGLHGDPDPQGQVEIGFGLAEAYHGHGYGTELVAGIVGSLAAHPEIKRITGRTVPGNIASQVVMERAGLRTESGTGDGGGHLTYVLRC